MFNNAIKTLETELKEIRKQANKGWADRETLVIVQELEQAILILKKEKK